ncbi:DUF4254 domain-containing protein [Actinosynnema sp. NPDC047251]|uniref:DUF4254 domain-containing protein n=1 Tax=Saccharothrix espanaensis TaxID=103731 RepID=UPI0003010F89|nr:DUF4254 domain-containing protein [Saccharothrix espanaensis]
MVLATADPRTPPGLPEDVSLPSGTCLVRAFGGEPTLPDDLLPIIAALVRTHWDRADAVSSAHDEHADESGSASAARVLGAGATARQVLVNQIDQWAADRLPDAVPAALLHTETLGQLVDRLAAAWVSWRTLAGHPRHHRDPHDTADALATLANAYDDLLTDLRSGRRRLPGVPLGAFTL